LYTSVAPVICCAECKSHESIGPSINSVIYANSKKEPRDGTAIALAETMGLEKKRVLRMKF
jgi:hypothetical protein